MQDKPADHVHSHTDRRPAVWPWLLIPLVTLALFFALSTARKHAEARGHTVGPPAIQDTQ